MRRVIDLMPEGWRRQRPSRTVYVGSHEDKLSRLPSMRIDPDDDGRTREDVEHQRTERRGHLYRTR
jgi:hypothetical protein